MQTLTEAPCPLEERTLNRVGQTSKIVPQNVLPPQDLTSNEQSLHNTLAHQRRLSCGDGSESHLLGQMPQVPQGCWSVWDPQLWGEKELRCRQM